MSKAANVDPQGMQMLEASMKTFEGWVQHMNQPPGAQKPQAPAAAGPKGPMPANASMGSKPAGY